ncbi:MAG: oxygenase MpaB family protein [Mycobacterium sp.]
MTPPQHPGDQQVEPTEFLRSYPMRLLTAALGDSIRPTQAQLDTYLKYAEVCDPAADNLVAAMRNLPKGSGRNQFEQALEHGIDTVADPLPELTVFFETLEATPYWVDFGKIALAGRTISRIPARSLLATAASMVFPWSYLASRANQVLIRSGDLDEKAAARIVESLSWLIDCASPGAMSRFSEGFKSTARVRLIHGYARAGINSLDDWDYAQWDVPVNQSQQMITWVVIILPGVLVPVLGHLVGPREAMAVLHLLRYMGHLLGIRPELQISSVRDLMRIVWLAGWYEFKPDEFSPRLADAAYSAIPAFQGLPTRGPLAGPVQWAVRRMHTDLSFLVLGPRHRKILGVPMLSPMLLALPLITVKNLVTDIAAVVAAGGTAKLARKRGQRQRAEIKRLSRELKANLTYNRENAKLRTVPSAPVALAQ